MAEPEHIFIAADEVDEPPPPPEAFDVAPDRLDSLDLSHRNGSIQPGPRPIRPALKRDKSAPQPAGTWIDVQRPNDADVAQDAAVIDGQAPGLWNPAENAATPTDSLSLGQLKKLVQEMPKVEPTPYAFEYADTSSFEEDLEELFGYTWEERRNLISSRETFERIWKAFKGSDWAASPGLEDDELDWSTADPVSRRRFLERLRTKLSHSDEADRMESLEVLLYLALGCWHETAGLRDPSVEIADSVPDDGANLAPGEPLYELAAIQTRCMRENIQLIVEIIHISPIFGIMRAAFEPPPPSDDGGQLEIEPQPDILQQRERSITQVLVYLFVDLARREAQAPLGRQLQAALDPIAMDLLIFLTNVLVKTRWDDAESVPPSKLLILYWKTILLVFGGTSDIDKIKAAFASGDCEPKENTDEPRITASPLDYHVFRQEIISKYPAYNPPPALFPFERDNNSFLPPLQDFIAKSGANPQNGIGTEGPANIPGAGTSIINQPVHIATPAPSPPPSPAGPGGKGLKKQNYQTNQMFPFLYPPLDESSNDLGGKGTTELQDLFAGRKWHGSDVPASILEAADLFAKRMRATRAMKQLWEERVRFIKFEQGYGSLDSVNDRDRLTIGWIGKLSPDDIDDLRMLNDDQRARLNAVETFYKDVLPRLQSMVIVLLKPLVQTITTLITQADGLEGLQGNGSGSDPNGQSTSGTQHEINTARKVDDEADPSFHDLVIIRNQEILGKAVSGILVLLLKWFKVSHILKFEYLTQILLDSNYIQLVLKLFTHQELERAVNYRCEHKDLNFFNFCQANSRNPNPASTANHENGEDVDEAEPPPISLTRHGRKSPTLGPVPPTENPAPTPAPTQPPPNPPAPEVDELGYPISALPTNPITHYSWRTFFTSINNLRILQKILKSKPHRQLLMVQGKYSNTLKKHLKVPQPDIRLYTLKIIKGQVPYCHRKWRQSNMRIITAIYLHVKPGLRDEWLSGLDIEQEVGEALPAEQALRALTYWYNLRRYPGEMGMAESASVSASASALPPGIAGKFSEDFSLDSEPDLAVRDTNIAGEMSLFEDTAPLDTDGTASDSLAAAHPATDSQDVSFAAPSIAAASSKHPNPSPGPAGLETSSTKDVPDTDRAAQPQVPPLMLREQDFFLRELEKMDLGLSLPSPSASRSSSRHSSRPVSAAGAAAAHSDGSGGVPELEPDIDLAPLAPSVEHDAAPGQSPHPDMVFGPSDADPDALAAEMPPEAVPVAAGAEDDDDQSMLVAMRAAPEIQAQARAEAAAAAAAAPIPPPVPTPVSVPPAQQQQDEAQVTVTEVLEP